VAKDRSAVGAGRGWPLTWDLILIRKSTVSRRAAASGLCPDLISWVLMVR